MFFHACFQRVRCLTNVNRITVFTLDLVYDSSGSLFLDLVFWLFEYVGDGASRLMGNLDVEISKNFCDSLGKTFGVGQDNKSTLVGIIHLLLSIRLAATVNEVNRVVIGGEGFPYSLSFPCDFFFGGRNVLCAIHKGACDRVLMSGMVV